jgi:hypothetical protein
MGIYWSWTNGQYSPLLTINPSNTPAGYNMAKNLRSNLPSTDTLLIYDVNAGATKRFVEEEQSMSNEATIKVAGDVREVAENSVSCF